MSVVHRRWMIFRCLQSTTPRDDRSAGLTARETEVLELVADGLRNAEIAERLVVSEKTVAQHR